MRVLRTLLASGILLVVGVVVLAGATDHFQAFTSETARRVEIRQHPPQVPAVTLETQSGARIDLADLRGKWVLVDFIYTRCMTYCSALGVEFAQLQDQLAKPLAQGKVQLLSISFDRAHDTPPALTNYLALHHGRGRSWIAARPVDAQGLETLEQVFRVTVIPDGLGGYVHNAGIEIVDPQGRLVRIFDIGNPTLAGQAVLRYVR